MLLTSRKLLQGQIYALENDLRGSLRTFGLKVGYHNHAQEFIASFDGQTAYERFVDAYWAERHGYDAGDHAADYWARVAHRVGCLLTPTKLDAEQIELMKKLAVLRGEERATATVGAAEQGFFGKLRDAFGGR